MAAADLAPRDVIWRGRSNPCYRYIFDTGARFHRPEPHLRAPAVPAVLDAGKPPAGAEPAPPPGIARAIGGSVFVSDWVRATARHHGISRPPLPLNVLAGTGRHLSDAEVRLDAIGQLLLALAEAGVVTEPQRRALQVAYLRQVG